MTEQQYGGGEGLQRITEKGPIREFQLSAIAPPTPESFCEPTTRC